MRKGGKRKKEEMRMKRQNEGGEGKSERKGERTGKPHKSDNLWQKGVLKTLS